MRARVHACTLCACKRACLHAGMHTLCHCASVLATVHLCMQSTVDHRQGTAFAYFNWARLRDFQLHADVQHAADHANLRYDAEKRPQHDGPAAIVDVREYGSMPSLNR